MDARIKQLPGPSQEVLDQRFRAQQLSQPQKMTPQDVRSALFLPLPFDFALTRFLPLRSSVFLTRPQYKFLAYIMLGIFGVVGGVFAITGGAVWYLFGREGARFAGDYIPNQKKAAAAQKALETVVEATKAVASASARVEL